MNTENQNSDLAMELANAKADNEQLRKELEKVKRFGRKMREAQTQYFKYKNNLNDCKTLERDFDKMVEEKKAEANQIKLF